MECPDDAAAMRVLVLHRHQYIIELWQGSRQVRIFSPVPRQLKSADAKRVDTLAAIAILLSKALTLAKGQGFWELVEKLEHTLAHISAEVDSILDMHGG